MHFAILIDLPVDADDEIIRLQLGNMRVHIPVSRLAGHSISLPDFLSGGSTAGSVGILPGRANRAFGRYAGRAREQLQGSPFFVGIQMKLSRGARSGVWRFPAAAGR
jgi:hypothetical protein